MGFSCFFIWRLHYIFIAGWDVTETSFSLEELAKKLLKEEVGLLVAEKTVAILEKLIKKVKISYKEIIQSAEPVMKWGGFAFESSSFLVVFVI